MGMVLFSCQMLEDEIALAMEKTGRQTEVVWLERRLHSSPEHLRGAVQNLVNQRPAGETVLMALAQCGNAFLGLESGRATLVLPRFSDCLRMLRSTAPGDPGPIDIRTMYLTRGWLQGDKAMLNEYRQYAARVGEKKAKMAYRLMMKEYRELAMMDTGAYDIAAAEEGGRATADLLGLRYATTNGGTRVLEKLLTGPWDEEFIVVPPGGRIGADDFDTGTPAACQW